MTGRPADVPEHADGDRNDDATTPEVVPSGDDLSVVAGAFRLVFSWVTDRWSHRIDIDGRPVTGSVEWDAGHGDPTRVVSPAFQQVTGQTSGESAEALVVGQWGHHHFSGVFRVERVPGCVTLSADLAVRTRGRLDALAATYDIGLTADRITDAGPGGVEWSLGDAGHGRLRLEPLAVGGAEARVLVAESGRAGTRAQVDVPVAPGERTQRLAYRWVWSTRPSL